MPVLPPLEHYQMLVRSEAITADPAQARAAAALDKLYHDIRTAGSAQKSSALGWILGARKKTSVKGLYIHGSVGRGKTMLMDLFFAAVSTLPKRRVHFHAFMTEVQDRIQAYRADVKAGRVKDTDPIPPVARAIAKEAQLFCFDEFQVTDIADAMILGRLFETLFEEGVVVVATSNLPPERLYHNGLNRQLFLPFIEMLNSELNILHLDSDKDYRHRALTRSEMYFSPLGEASDAAMNRLWNALTLSAEGASTELKIMGRSLIVPRSASGVARFNASDLLDKPLGARDFLAITENYHTILLDHLPELDKGGQNPQRRFVLLVDTAYDAKRALAISAACPEDQLVTTGPLAFEFERTVSRLVEMRSEEYLAEVNLARQTS